MSDVEVKVKISKDSADFDKGLADSTAQAERLADVIKDEIGGKGAAAAGALSKVVSGPMLIGLGAAAAAGAILKTSLDFTLAAETIRQVSSSFNNMAASAGLVGKSLREDILSAAEDMAGGEEILQASSRAIAQLGEQAAILPQTMELARKATIGFGGDLVSNYGAFNQALATGNARALREFGIIVDTKKAVDDYAKSIGVASNVLSEYGRQQAIQRTILAQAEKALKGIDENAMGATKAHLQLKEALDDVVDALKLGISNSGFWKSALEKLTLTAQGWANIVQRAFGNEDVTTTMIRQGGEIQNIQAKIRDLKKELKDASILEKPILAFELNQLNGQLTRAKTEYLSLQAEMKKSAPSQQPGSFVKMSAQNPGPDKPAENVIDMDAYRQSQMQALAQIQGFRGQLLAAQEAYYSQNNNLAQRTIDLDAVAEQKKMLVMQEFELKKQALEAANAQTRMFTRQQMNEAEILLESEKQYRMLAIQDETNAQLAARSKQLNDALKATLVQGISSSIVAFGKALATGENAFEAFGKGLIDMLADLSIQVGTACIAAGIALGEVFKGNPAGAILFGAALLALGGVLKGFASRGSSGGGGVASAPTNAAGAITANPELESRGPQTTIQVNVQGSVFDTAETGMRITEILNENFNMRDSRIA